MGYSVGVILFFLLSADYPYEEDATVLRRMRPPDMTHEAWSSVSEDAVKLVTELMDATAISRPTAQQVLASHWFSMDVDSSPLAVPLLMPANSITLSRAVSAQSRTHSS